MTMYTIKCEYLGRCYYLVNGWRKCKTFWFNESSTMENPDFAKQFFFKTPGQAKANLTKLLKVIPNYATNHFEIVSF